MSCSCATPRPRAACSWPFRGNRRKPTSPAAGNAAPSPPPWSGLSSNGAKRCCGSNPDEGIFFTGGPMARVKDEDWVEVASTGQDEEALLVAGLLEAAEIPPV